MFIRSNFENIITVSNFFVGGGLLRPKVSQVPHTQLIQRKAGSVLEILRVILPHVAKIHSYVDICKDKLCV